MSAGRINSGSASRKSKGRMAPVRFRQNVSGKFRFHGSDSGKIRFHGFSEGGTKNRTLAALFFCPFCYETWRKLHILIQMLQVIGKRSRQ